MLELKLGQEVKIVKAFIREGKTTPPRRFTDGELLTAMENIHLYVDDEASRRKLREASGIGTPATRSSLIKDMIAAGLLMEAKPAAGEKPVKGKRLVRLMPSPHAMELIDQLPRLITDPAMTAFWEDGIKEIRAGQLAVKDFIAQQGLFMRQVVAQYSGRLANLPPAANGATGQQVANIDGSGEACPKCKKGVLRTMVIKKEGPNKGKAFLSCSEWKSGCDYKQWPE